MIWGYSSGWLNNSENGTVLRDLFGFAWDNFASKFHGPSINIDFGLIFHAHFDHGSFQNLSLDFSVQMSEGYPFICEIEWFFFIKKSGMDLH